MKPAASLAAVAAALSAWKAADDELAQLEKLGQEALRAGASADAIREMGEKLAHARARRERTYRGALQAMKAHQTRLIQRDEAMSGDKKKVGSAG